MPLDVIFSLVAEEAVQDAAEHEREAAETVRVPCRKRLVASIFGLLGGVAAAAAPPALANRVLGDFARLEQVRVRWELANGGFDRRARLLRRLGQVGLFIGFAGTSPRFRWRTRRARRGFSVLLRRIETRVTWLIDKLASGQGAHAADGGV